MKSAITISIDRGLLRACRSAAYASRRTLSAQIEQWIDEKLARAAMTPAPPSPAKPAEEPASGHPANHTPAAALPVRQRGEVVS